MVCGDVGAVKQRPVHFLVTADCQVGQGWLSCSASMQLPRTGVLRVDAWMAAAALGWHSKCCVQLRTKSSCGICYRMLPRSCMRACSCCSSSL
jgi:hypothetical protein